MFGVDFRAYYAKSRFAFALSVLIVLVALAYAISQGNTCIQSYNHLDLATSTEIVSGGVPFPRLLLQLWNTSSETDADFPLGLCKNDDELYYPFIISNCTYCLVNAAISKIATSSNRYLRLTVYVGDQNVSHTVSDIANNINVLAYSVPDAFRGTEIQVATRVLADPLSVERNWCPLFSDCEYIMSPLRHLRYMYSHYNDTV